MNPKNTLLTTLLICISVITFSQDYWEPMNPPGGLSMFDICVDSEGRIYLACPFPSEDLTGIYRSDDNGINWERKIEGMNYSNPQTRSIAIDNLDNIIVGETNRIYRSGNLGEEWTEVYHESSGANNFNVSEFGYDSIFLVGGNGNNGIVRSGDNGQTWQVVLDFTEFEPDYPEALTGVFFAPDGKIYACSQTYVGGSGSVYISEDYGLSWSVFYNNGFSVFFSIAFDHTGRLLVGSNGIHRYDFTTGAWEHQSYNIISQDILIAPENKIYIADPYNGGGFGVVYSGDNGETYEVLNSGMISPDARDFAIDLTGRILTCGSLSISLYRSYDTLIITDCDYEPYEKKRFHCYPNPFNSYTNIQSTIEEKVYVNIINTSGKIVFESIIDGYGTLKFNGEQIPPGLYIAVLKAKNFNKIIKLIHH